MLGLLRELLRLGRHWGLARMAHWRAEAVALIDRERRRLFDAMALLSVYSDVPRKELTVV